MTAQQILSGRTILVVEYDYQLAMALARQLSELGAVVLGPSSNVEDALRQIASTDHLAGAILDANLGEEMVFPVADELERLHIPFLFATGYEPDVIPAHHRERIVLRKPLEEDAVAAALLRATNLQGISLEEASRNQILARLAKSQLAVIAPVLRRVYLPRGALLEVPHQDVSQIFFPLDCIISLIAVASDGTRTEAGLIGKEGMSGTGLAVGDDQTPHELVNQIEGEALVMTADAFLAVMTRVPDLRLLANRFARALSVQVSHTALANGSFKVPRRLARWLLMVDDRTDGDAFNLTHDYLAIMLAVRRPSVTDALHILEGEGLIRSTRSNIAIRDRRGLVAYAGQGYGLPEAEYVRLMSLPMESRPTETIPNLVSQAAHQSSFRDPSLHFLAR